MAVSIKDVAQRAGVPPSTVFGALYDHPCISLIGQKAIHTLLHFIKGDKEVSQEVVDPEFIVRSPTTPL